MLYLGFMLGLYATFAGIICWGIREKNFDKENVIESKAERRRSFWTVHFLGWFCLPCYAYFVYKGELSWPR